MWLMPFGKGDKVKFYVSWDEKEVKIFKNEEEILSNEVDFEMINMYFTV